MGKIPTKKDQKQSKKQLQNKMVVNLSPGIPGNNICPHSLHIHRSRSSRPASTTVCGYAPALLAAAVIFTSSVPDSSETFSNVPQTLSGDDGKPARIQRPRSRKAESCTIKCVGTCIRGGGEGPLNVRRPLVVFKEGFRSRHYCLVECSDICNLIKDGEDGP